MIPPTDTVSPSRVWYRYWGRPSSWVIYWKAWDGAFQFRLVVVSLKDMGHRLFCIKCSTFSIYILCIIAKQTKTHWLESLQSLQLIMLLDVLQVEDRSNLHRKNGQQFLFVGDVRYCRLCAVKEAQEDVASVSSVAVNFLCCLLGQAAHHTPYSVNKEEKWSNLISHIMRNHHFTKLRLNYLVSYTTFSAFTNLRFGDKDVRWHAIIIL